jgi:hypothetical protein
MIVCARVALQARQRSSIDPPALCVLSLTSPLEGPILSRLATLP